MFVVTTEHEFTWPVTVKVPQDGGTYARFSFAARFRQLSKEEREEIRGPRAVDDSAIVRKAVIGWDDQIVDEDRNPVPFSREALDALIDVPYVLQAFARAYTEAMYGLKEKN